MDGGDGRAAGCVFGTGANFQQTYNLAIKERGTFNHDFIIDTATGQPVPIPATTRDRPYNRGNHERSGGGTGQHRLQDRWHARWRGQRLRGPLRITVARALSARSHGARRGSLRRPRSAGGPASSARPGWVTQLRTVNTSGRHDRCARFADADRFWTGLARAAAVPAAPGRAPGSRRAGPRTYLGCRGPAS